MDSHPVVDGTDARESRFTHMSDANPTPNDDSDGSTEGDADRTVDEAEADRRPLWVVIEIDVGDDCPLTDVDRPIHDVDLQQMGRVCRSQIVTGDEEVEVLHMERRMGTECVADVFHDHDCVPHVTDVREDSILITVHPCDRSMIPELVGGLQAVGYPARVDRIVRIDEEVVGTPPVLCDFSLLTEKQQEALMLAVERGYYEQPRQATLEDIAEDLDVGKSAVSHRLKAAEAKIIRNHLPRTNDRERSS
ncbi:MAG: putative DNA binding protein [Halobacteriales archaeon]